MKYQDITWNLEINGEHAHFDEPSLDFIAEEIARGNTSGFFTTDCTNYEKCDKLKEKLEQELGRIVDFSVEDDDKGELEELLQIAEKNEDFYIVEIIKDILAEGFEN